MRTAASIVAMSSQHSKAIPRTKPTMNTAEWMKYRSSGLESEYGGEGMLYEVKRFYYCPFCGDVYDNELEAEWCRDDCAKKEKIWSTQKIVCSACGRYFETEKEFCDHLLGCKGETCATCEHCDLEMRRSGPCREMNGSKVIEACSHFVRALK